MKNRLAESDIEEFALNFWESAATAGFMAPI